MTKHNDTCTAPICVDDNNPEYKTDVLWYPGEEVCGKSPMSRWQRNQRRINKLVKAGRFKNVDRYFTVKSLETIKRITPATKGADPEKPRKGPFS